MKSFKLFQFFTLALLCFAFASQGQIGASADKGTYLNYNSFINSPQAFGGDVDIDLAGVLELGVNGILDIYGAVSNKGKIEVDSNAVLTIHGNMNNDGDIIIHKGATVKFHGKIWKNTSTAKVADGNVLANTTPGGELIVDTYRPVISSDWTTASSYLTAYSNETGAQYMDGGNIAMDATLHLNNPKDIELINSTTRIEGGVQWDANGTQLILGNNDLVFSTNANQNGFTPKKYAVTNGTGHVVKENFTGKWIFPVGIDTNDYTPAQVENIRANTLHIAVQDYNTSASVENTPYTVQDGVNRTWNIFADTAKANSIVTLQHNDVTNQAVYNEFYNFVTRWSGIEENLSGDDYSVTAWQENSKVSGLIGVLSTAGLVAGSHMNSRSYSTFATSATDPIAFFTKSSESFRPAAGAQLLTFTADSIACDVDVEFKVGKEPKIAKYLLQHSTDSVLFTTISSFTPTGDSSTYTFKHLTALDGINYYRLALVEPDETYSLSKVISTEVRCTATSPVVVLYPNPATDYINIAGLVGASEIRILNMHGRVMGAVSTRNAVENIDVSTLPSAPYIAQIITGKKLDITSIKFIKL